MRFWAHVTDPDQSQAGKDIFVLGKRSGAALFGTLYWKLSQKY